MVFETTPWIVSNWRVVPNKGSNSKKSEVVTTRACPSKPKATPKGGALSTKFCRLLVGRSISVSELRGAVPVGVAP